MANNAAPNYVPYTEERTYIPLNPRIPARLAQIVMQAQVPVDQFMNNQPLINAQTYWSRGVVQTAQGFRKYSNSRR